MTGEYGAHGGRAKGRPACYVRCVALRDATPADLAAIEALERAAFPQDPLPRVTLVQYLELFEGLFLVADGGAALLAYAVAGVTGEGRIGWLLSAAVASEARGQGLGSALTQALVDRLRARGLFEIRATVAPHNTASRRMLSAAGLTVQAELPDYFGPGEHRLLMRWTADVDG